jgi:YVTN family beta-propeller protein
MKIIHLLKINIIIFSSIFFLCVNAQTITNQIPVGDGPAGIAITPDGTLLYSVNEIDATVSVIDLSNNSVVSTISIGTPQGSYSYGIAITPDGRYAYVTLILDNTVKVIDISTNTVVNSVSVGNGPFGIAITPDGNHAYVTNSFDNTVSVIDINLNIVSGVIAVGSKPYGARLNSTGTKLYVVNKDSNQISIIDTSSNLVISTINVNSLPSNVTINSSDTKAYVTHETNQISVIDIATNSVISTIYNPHPWDMAISPNGSYAYITNMYAGIISIMDMSTETIFYRIVNASAFAPIAPWGIVFALDGSRAYITDHLHSDSVQIINNITPTISSVTPNSGLVNGGTNITINGSGFVGVTSVDVGGANCVSFFNVSDTQINCFTAPNSSGSSSVRVQTLIGGYSTPNTLFTYVAPAPVVTSVSPTSGSATGGMNMTITGNNFSNSSAVTVGGNACTSFTVNSATSITCITPAGTAGTASVSVTTPGGTSAANTLFSYFVPAPVVTSVSPTSGSATGGMNMTITGNNFSNSSAVTVGGNACTSFTVNSATSITCITPAGTAGTASVSVTTPGGTSAANTLFSYFVPAPVVTSVSPTSGSATGGMNMTITGNNFSNSSAVTVGGNACTSFTVNSATSITCITPAGTAGTASVSVTTPGGTSAANTLFSYFVPAPVVTSVSPTSGSATGGMNMTITGNNFSNSSAVTVGGNACTSFTVNSATSITCITPAGTAGTASVSVTTPGGTSAANTLFSYFVPVPAAIPTLGEWAMIFMASLMAIFGIRRMRRSK